MYIEDVKLITQMHFLEIGSIMGVVIALSADSLQLWTQCESQI
jgi:hypothetical protein